MGNYDFSRESPSSFEQRSICCFVVDVSFSMSGNPMRELNKGLKEFHNEILEDSLTSNRLEVAIVEFGSDVSVRLKPSLPNDFSLPQLRVKGSTRMVDGVQEAISLVESRKDWYRDQGIPYLRPWIILITDGAPDDDQDVQMLSEQIENLTKNKKLVFIPIGVEGADMDILNMISGYSSREGNWMKMPAMKLQGLKFSDFFKWVSASMAIVAGSKEEDKINLPDPSDWMQGFTI